MSDELKSVPFSNALKTLIQKYFADARQATATAVEQDALERALPAGTQFDLQQMCFLVSAEPDKPKE